MIVVSGGGTKAYAFIKVTYSVGSICTCSDGQRTLSAKGTSGNYVFYIPYAGTWTVTISDGTQTKSKAVLIESEYQVEIITILFNLLLVDKNYTISAPQKVGHSGSTVGFDSDGYLRLVCPAAANTYTTMYLSNPIDVTDFDKLVLTFQSRGYVTNTIYGLANLSSIKAEMGTGDYVAYTRDNNSRGRDFSTVKTEEIDVSNISGSFYLCTNQAGSGGSNYTGDCVIRFAQLQMIGDESN